MKAPLLNRYRRLAFSFFIAVLVAVFLLGYFYYFIPRNREAIHRNGFTVLHNISRNIAGKTTSHELLFTNVYKNKANLGQQQLGAVQHLIADLKIDAVVAEGNVHQMLGLPDSSTMASSRNPARFEITGATDKDLVFSNRQNSGANVAYFLEPIAPFLQPVLASQKTEMFESYMLVKADQGHLNVLYKDADIGSHADITFDSLLGNTNQRFFADIRDVKIADINYKLFYYPFDLGKAHLILCGFQPASTYTARLQAIPFFFIYILTVCILMLLVLLPVIKFYMMDSNERVGLNDLIMFVLSIFVAASLITLIIIHSLLWKGEETRVKSNLAKLSDKIENNFLLEITHCYDQLNIADSLAALSANISPASPDTQKLRWASNIINKIDFKHYDPATYYNFDRISWINDTGTQIVKAETFSKPVYANVSEREYFKAFKKNQPLILPDGSGRQYYWEAIYSWTNADFSISLSKRSRWRNAYLTVMAAKMYSVLNTVMPAGYGFCIIDENGNVKIHSDGDRNLREDFFKKVRDPNAIIGAVRSRQRKTFNEENFYGRENIVDVKPLRNMPFYLITFYDKGDIVPINMRILIFACLFCLSWFFVSVAVCWALIPKYFFRFPVLFSSMDCLKFIVPQKKNELLYFHSIIFLIIYLLVSIAFLLLAINGKIENHTIFILISLAPINLAFGITLIYFKMFNEISVGNSVHRGPANRRLVLALHIGITLLSYFFLIAVGLPPGLSFFIFQGIFHAILIAYLFGYTRWKSFSYNPVRSYIPFYSWTVVLLILCLSVLPASIYTWYAHNQEITQTLKKQQLHLVEEIKERTNRYAEIRTRHAMPALPSAYTDSLYYRYGIYSIYNDRLNIEADSAMTITKDRSESFYLSIADKVGNPYYDSRSFPILGNTASDLGWFWQKDGNTLKFWYRLPGFAYYRPGLQSNYYRLALSSQYPRRFLFLGSPVPGLVLFFLAVALILALYTWVRINTGRIFLKKYIQTEKDNIEIPKRWKSLVKEYFSFGKEVPSFEIAFPTVGENGLPIKPGSVADFNHQEKSVLDELKDKTDLFKYIWLRCSEKEKYLLVNFARVGLINYKNTLEIYDLFRKGLLVVNEEKMISLFSIGFRAFLLEKVDTSDLMQIEQKFQKTSTWRAFRLPLFLIFLAVACFVFFTQEAIFQKIIALGAAVSSLATILPRFLSPDKGSGKVE